MPPYSKERSAFKLKINMATFDELEEKYGFKETLEEVIKRNKQNVVLNATYSKHLPACWIIEDIYGQLSNETISLGKARELTAAVIEEHFKNLTP